MNRHLLPMLLLVLPWWAAAADPPQDRAQILAAQMLRRGQADLTAIAQALEVGEIRLEQAALLTTIARNLRELAGPPPAPAALPISPEQEAKAEAALRAYASSRNPPPAAEPPPTKPVAEPVKTASPAVEPVKPDPPVTTTRPAEPPAAEVALGRVVAVTTDKSGTLVMIDGGSSQGVKPDQRYRLRRNGLDLVLALATAVEEQSTILYVMDSTWKTKDRELRKGDEVLPDERPAPRK